MNLIIFFSAKMQIYNTEFVPLYHVKQNCDMLLCMSMSMTDV